METQVFCNVQPKKPKNPMKHHGFEVIDKKPFILATFRWALAPSAERFESWCKTKKTKKPNGNTGFLQCPTKKTKKPNETQWF